MLLIAHSLYFNACARNKGCQHKVKHWNGQKTQSSLSLKIIKQAIFPLDRADATMHLPHGVCKGVGGMA